MKTAFWREAITPGAVAAGGYEFVWLFDNDLAVDAVDLPALARTMAKVGTPLIQPRIAGSDDYFVHLRAHPEPPVPPDCLAVSTNYIAPWAPFFAAPAWAAVHTHMLARVPAGLLALTDWGVPDHWCRLLSSVYLGGGACSPTRPPPSTVGCPRAPSRRSPRATSTATRSAARTPRRGGRARRRSTRTISSSRAATTTRCTSCRGWRRWPSACGA